MRARLSQILLIVGTIVCAWLGMMIVHEAGHAGVALLTGGRVQRVVLPVVGFSRTDVFPNPRPLAVVWGGPVVGELLPVLAWLLAEALGLSWAYLLRFFGGFCLVANGAYIGAASFERVGDAYPMLLFGSEVWQLWVFGVVSFVAGLWVWHGLGQQFGLGPRGRRVRWVHVAWVWGSLVVVVAVDVLLTRLS